MDPFTRAMEDLLALGAERVIILEGPPLRQTAAHGLATGVPWSEQVSLTLLQDVFQDGEAVLLGDARTSPYSDRWSLIVTEIRSVLCVPFWSSAEQVAGLLYADTRSRTGVFSKGDLDAVQRCARKLEQTLYGRQAAPVATPVLPPAPDTRRAGPIAPRGALGLRADTASPRRPTPTPPVAPRPPAAQPGKRPGNHALVLFFRSLATMVGAGLTLSRALEVLAEHSEDPTMRAVSESLATQICTGTSLSAGMQAFPAFDRFDVRLVRMGETSGCLHLVLRDLAEHREKAHAAQMRLRSALIYPALVVTACVAMMLIVPPYVLDGQFRIIRESGQTPPLLTQAVMAMSSFLRTPIGLPLVLGALAAAGAAVGYSFRRPQTRQLWIRAGLTRPVLGRALRLAASARFASALALMQRAGIRLPEALSTAAACSDNPVLEENMPRCLQALTDGAGVADSLARADFFPAAFLHMVAAGEETGQLDRILNWIAQLYDLELEAALQTWLALLEPALMLGMGILVGIMLVATLLPMLGVLQTL